MRVDQLMTHDVKVCRTDDMLSRAAQLMWEGDCGCLPVISSNGDARLLGIITDRDIAMAAYIQGWQLSAIPVASVISREVVVCHRDDPIDKAEALMREHRVRRLPVVDREQRLAGILSLNDIAREAHREASCGPRSQVTSAGVSDTLAVVSEPRTHTRSHCRQLNHLAKPDDAASYESSQRRIHA